MRWNISLRKALATVALLSVALFGAPPEAAANDFENFGGLPRIEKVVDRFIVELRADAKIGSFFTKSSDKRLKKTLTEQFCEELGGPCKYSGIDMKRMHANMDIRMEHFNALVEALQRAMEAEQVPFAAQNKLLARLAPMHRDIVRSEVPAAK